MRNTISPPVLSSSVVPQVLQIVGICNSCTVSKMAIIPSDSMPPSAWMPSTSVSSAKPDTAPSGVDPLSSTTSSTSRPSTPPPALSSSTATSARGQGPVAPGAVVPGLPVEEAHLDGPLIR